MIHEYIEDLDILVDALQAAYKNIEFIVGVANAINMDLDSRGITKC